MTKTMLLGALMGLVGVVLIIVSAMTGASLPYWLLGVGMVAWSLGLTKPR